jgi:hypothetical protein
MTDERIMTLRTMEMLANGEITQLDRETLLALPARELLAASLYWLFFESRLLGPPIIKMNAIRYLELCAQLDESYRDPGYEPSEGYFPADLSGLTIEVVNADGVAEAVDPEALEEALLQLADSGDKSTLYALTGGSIESDNYGLAAVRRSARKVQAKATVAQVGLALSAYNQETGSYPDDLGVLAPGFMDEIPLDPYGNEPLICRREDEGFVVYSVGPDREDDGGVYEEIIRYTSPGHRPILGIPPEKDDIAWRMSH